MPSDVSLGNDGQLQLCDVRSSSRSYPCLYLVLVLSADEEGFERREVSSSLICNVASTLKQLQGLEHEVTVVVYLRNRSALAVNC